MQINRLKIFYSFIILFFVGPMFGQYKDQNFATKDVESDLEYLYQSLQETHYNLFAFTSKKDYLTTFTSIKEKIKGDSLSSLQTVSLFQTLVSFANTGHCEIDFPVQSYIKYAYAGGTVFPLELAFEQGKVYTRKNLSDNTIISHGNEILNIDGKPMDQLLEMLHPFVSAERAYFKKAKMEFWSFPRLYFQAYGTKNEWLVQLKDSNNNTFNTTIKAIPVIDYETKRNGELVNPQQTFRYYGKIAYLNPGAFGSSDSNGEVLFEKYIDSVFADIKIRGSSNLIIDLRCNPGGHNAYSDYLIGYFANKPFKWYSSFSIKTSKILKEHTRSQIDTSDNYSKTILSNADGKIFPYEFPAYNPVENSKRFNGKIYVLINRQTYSMAAVVAALIQDYKFGKIVGEETGDLPTLYASQFSYSLPKTGVLVKVPKGYIVRPSGNKDLVGVKPDIEIKDHLLDDQDEILENLLKKIGEK